MSETIKNLTKAFIGESMARNRYALYAKQARKDGFEQIAEVFETTADQEREHAKWLFRHIQELKQEAGLKTNAELKVETEVPTVLGSTLENLKAAIAGENYEYTSMYPEFARKAQEEDFANIAVRLKMIAKAEEHHEERYKKLLKEVRAETVFKKEEEKEWTCRKCGYVHKGKTPPKECPSCGHPTAYFQVKYEEY